MENITPIFKLSENLHLELSEERGLVPAGAWFVFVKPAEIITLAKFCAQEAVKDKPTTLFKPVELNITCKKEGEGRQTFEDARISSVTISGNEAKIFIGNFDMHFILCLDKTNKGVPYILEIAASSSHFPIEKYFRFRTDEWHAQQSKLPEPAP